MDGKTKNWHYLLDNRACDRSAVDKALKKQSALESRDQYKSVGEILLKKRYYCPGRSAKRFAGAVD
jgi:hypothetical protein